MSNRLLRATLVVALTVLPAVSLASPTASAAAPVGVTSISAGSLHTCAVTTAGAAKCWGYNGDGRIGNGTYDEVPTPSTVTGLGSGVAAVATGASHACALTTGGAVKCWGSNLSGQLGNGTYDDSIAPVAVTGLSSGVAAIAVGFGHSCAMTTAGGVRCWGANANGQLGNGTTTESTSPVTVTGLPTTVKRIAVGPAQLGHTCAVTTAGAAWCWGANGNGQLGNGTFDNAEPTPIPVHDLTSGVAEIDAGSAHTCAVTTAGAATCWGYNGYGELGNGTTSEQREPFPVLGFSSGVRTISAGLSHTCATTSTGMSCWGYGADGELGNDDESNSLVPVTVKGIGPGAQAITTGDYHTCAITSSSAARCWGGNGYGQLGTGAPYGSSVPAGVSGLSEGLAPALLRVVTSPALPSQITVDGAIADTWGLEWSKRSVGSHTVCFSAVAGYTTPSCQTVQLAAGATTTVTGTFAPRGYLQVSTSPAVASQIRVDGVPRDNWGVYTDVPVGSHEVCFGAVAGFTPPPCETVQVTAGATKAVTGTFTPSAAVGQAGVGQLRVTTSPALPSQITVDGAIADTWGLDWLELAPGSHAVCFAHVQGYRAPACQNVTVTAGATTSLVGTFTPRGFLKVDTSPAVGGTIFINGVPADDWGVFTDLLPGTYQVCFGEVPGRVAPSCQLPVVGSSGTTVITGTYT